MVAVVIAVVLVVSRAFTARRTKDLGNELELACSFWYAALAVFVVVAVCVFVFVFWAITLRCFLHT